MALGGSVQDVVKKNSARAWIDDGALVSAGRDITVNSDAFTWALIVTQSGGRANKFALDGSINFYDLDVVSQAWIEDGAVVAAGDDITVLADSQVVTFDVSASIITAAQVGIGVSISVTDISNTVHAFIGDGNGSGGPVGSVTAGDSVRVLANDPNRTGPNVTSWAISMSGVTDAGEVKDKSKGNGVTGSGSANSASGHAEQLEHERVRLRHLRRRRDQLHRRGHQGLHLRRRAGHDHDHGRGGSDGHRRR